MAGRWTTTSDGIGADGCAPSAHLVHCPQNLRYKGVIITDAYTLVLILARDKS